MIGEFTEKVRIYENIAKANGVEITQEIANTICDYLTYEEQIEENKTINEEKERIKELLNNQSMLKRCIKERYGSFYFSYYNKMLNILKPQYLTRALYLCSYMNYDNLLIEGKTHHKPIYESDLIRIWNISRAEMFNTKKELIDLGILIVNENKTLSISENFCKKGELMKNIKDEKARIFNDAIREIYEKAKPSEHKKLALLYKMLPYINLKWNMVCSNIDEEIKDLVQPIDVKTLCKLLNQSNVTKLKKDLLSLTVNGRPVVLMASVMNKSIILINPAVYYKGTRLEDVDNIEEMINNIVSAV
ncbi:hypothetical protein [Paraclostridium bifermentans]|uniref:hypothetical protein n=1 Tax=Paraclostridium bifermentans TaxID=1490 RepID=UPI00189D7E1C|nr:hypothetical protein [Paraclostridium bifermentans]